MKYFTDDEFKCNCGCGLDISQNVKNVILEARIMADIPFVINSGARCLEHNRKIGSRDTSSHIRGLAVDIKATTSREKYIIYKALMNAGATRFGINFDDGFIHFDLDREKPQLLMFGY